MPRYRLILAYDGTGFCGWQKQEPLIPPLPQARAEVEPEATGVESTSLIAPKTIPYSPDTPRIESVREGRVALRTVQGVVEQAVRAIVREPVEVIGASRTDAGVHARGQVAAFTCEPRTQLTASDAPAADPTAPRGVGWPIERGADRLASAINSRLPDDVRVLGAELADHRFDPIAGAVSKCYTYTYYVGLDRPLWDRRTVTSVRWDKPLELDAINRAGAILTGEHDFASFAAAGHGRLSTVRTIHELVVTRLDERRYQLRVVGSGFLWNMVRILAGTILQVGTGHRTPEDIRAVLDSRDRARAGPTMPPQGLCLEWIRYAENSTPLGPSSP